MLRGKQLAGEEVAEESHPDDMDTNMKSKHNQDESGQIKVIIATHVNVILYSTCFWIQIGVLPYLSKSLGIDAVIFGYLQTTFAVVQLCGGPFYGRFGDIFGGKAALLLSFLAASTAYSLMAISNSVALLFLSRIPSIGMHSMQGSQMVVTDVTDVESRAGALGKLGISYGIGMIVGPFVGGIVTTNFNEQTAAMVSAAGSMLSVAIALLVIPVNTKMIGEKFQKNEQLNKDNETTQKTAKENKSVFNTGRILSVLRIPLVAYLLAVKCICGIPFGIFQAMFSLMAMEYFKLGPKENGFVLSYVGIIGILVQGLGVGILTKRFKDTTLLSWSVVTIAIAYLLMITVTNIYSFCLVLTPLITGGSILQVIITSSITKFVPYQETGVAIGLSMATHAFIRSISPTIGGILFSYFGFPIFGITGFLINGALAIYLIAFGRKEF